MIIKENTEIKWLKWNNIKKIEGQKRNKMKIVKGRKEKNYKNIQQEV